MAVFDPVTKKFLCECGCGEEVPFERSFKPGHHMRTEENRGRLAKVRTGQIFRDRTRRGISKG